MGTQPSDKLGSAGRPPISDWDRVAANSEFRDLMAAKARFIVPATLFFVVYYFLLATLSRATNAIGETVTSTPLAAVFTFDAL